MIRHVEADYLNRIWDLSSIKKTSGGTGNGKVRSGRRASLSAMSATSHAGSENGRISCVGKVGESEFHYFISPVGAR